MLMKDASILIVDDDPDVLTAVRLLLKTEVKQVVTEKSPENLKYLLSQQPFDLILLDMNFNSSINTGNEGFFWLKKIKDYKSEAIVIMITAYGDIDLAVRSLKEGAADFVVKPWHNEKLIETLKDALKRKGKSNSAQHIASSSSIIGSELLGESKSMEEVFFKI
jgi:DNA-binding NtrC family response regulator